MYAPVQQRCTLNVFLSSFICEKGLMSGNYNALDKVQIKINCIFVLQIK